ncbi:MAG: RDD family protein [Candidatus Bathyarchaeia archaeon]
MVNCEKCGTELKEGAAFCQQCGAPVPPPQPVTTTPTPAPEAVRVIDLAGWGERIIAYIIDAIIFSVIFGILELIIALPTISFVGGMPYFRYTPFTSSGLRDVAFFIYFLWMDYSYGDSIGKRIMKIKVTNLNEGHITLGQAAIESFGKAFGPLIILDVIIGWIFMTQKSQRLFTYLAQTIVVKGKTPQ